MGRVPNQFLCRMAGFRRANWAFVRMSGRRDRKVAEIVPNGNQIRRKRGQAAAAREPEAGAAGRIGGRPAGGRAPPPAGCVARPREGGGGSAARRGRRRS